MGSEISRHTKYLGIDNKVKHPDSSYLFQWLKFFFLCVKRLTSFERHENTRLVLPTLTLRIVVKLLAKQKRSE